MTTAHKPTWKPATGGSEQGGNLLIVPTRHYSVKDMPAELTMKTRHREQGNEETFHNKNFKADLLRRERRHYAAAHGWDVEQEGEELKENETLTYSLPILSDDVHQGTLSTKRRKIEDNPFPQDADETYSDYSGSEANKKGESEGDSDKDSDSESDEEDEDALIREYEKVKKEREIEKLKIDSEKAKELEKLRQEEILTGNPVFNSASYSLKRKWNEDTVFKNQATTIPKEKKRFINDTLRSHFHRKFLGKYIQ